VRGNRRNPYLYTGITNSIHRRALQHKRGEIEGFTKRYKINRLVYYEVFHRVGNAIAREKQIKSWTRAKRLALIQAKNPTWQDLAEGWGERFELQIPRDVHSPAKDISARNDKGKETHDGTAEAVPVPEPP
jgi:putative endonuclease